MVLDFLYAVYAFEVFRWAALTADQVDESFWSQRSQFSQSIFSAVAAQILTQADQSGSAAGRAV
jgi:hypothetical protein